MSVFISHISAEAHIAEKLKEEIESAFWPKEVFVSSKDIPLGNKWAVKLAGALENSDVLLVLCSPTSIMSPWIKLEVGYGLFEQMPIIPIFHSGITKENPPEVLSEFQGLDIEKGFYRELFRWLTKRWERKKLSSLHYEKMDAELLEAIGPAMLGPIRFRSDHPEQEGWKLGTYGNRPKDPMPQFRTVEDSHFVKSIDIDLPKGHFMDHKVEETETKSTYVEFIIKPGRDCLVYTMVKIVSKDSNLKKNVWLAVKPGTDEPKPLGQGKNEWTIYVPESTMAGDWIKLGVDLPDQVEKTFGREGWQFDHLKKFRIRGNLSIAEIRMHKP